MKKVVLFITAVTLLAMMSSCSTYKSATAKCYTYRDVLAAREMTYSPQKIEGTPKLHKKYQFNPKKHYNEREWSNIFYRGR